MSATELTPILPKRLPRRYSKRLRKSIILMALLLIVILCTVYYIGSHSHSGAVLSAHHQMESKQSDELKEITINLHPDDIYHLEALDRTSDEWDDYHSDLITTKGYDPFDESVLYTFIMYDYHYDQQYYDKKYLRAYHEGHGDDNPIVIRTPRPTIIRTPRPSTLFTPRPTTFKSERPTRSPTEIKTARPTILRSVPTISRTPRPTILRTPAPTILRTSHPTTLRTTRPTLDWSVTSRHISIGGLTCYAKYSLNEKMNTDGHVLGCNDDHDTLVGCVGGSTHRPKPRRSGEKAVTHGCVANGESIYIRCCFPSNSTISMTGKVSQIQRDQNPNFPVYAMESFCQRTAVAGFDDVFQNKQSYYMVGCTGWAGTAEPFNSSLGITTKTQTSLMIGTKIVHGQGQSHCIAHRGDKKGFIAAPAIVVGLDNAELECILVESTIARQPKNQPVNSGQEKAEWASMAFCLEGYSLMDCSGYIDGIMDECDSRSKEDYKVTATLFHGTDLKCMADKEQHCSANGNTDTVRVQAHCCKIIN